jgi:Na+-transporting NADH:ubiquinone oxidoreductase subunit C
MAEGSNTSAWRRFLASPSDSRGKTIAMAFAVSAVCAVFVSGATVMLRPIQQANRAVEQQLRLASLIEAIPGMSEILQEAGDGAISTVVIDIGEGSAVEMTPAELDAALDDPTNWTELSPEQDMAGIASRPDYAQIYILRNDDRVSLVILPIFGAGYNGTIEALIALRGDMETIAGMTVTGQSETPGLGARIEEPAWQASFAGKRYSDDAGNMRFDVARGPSSSDYEVAVSRMVRFWLGPEGYEPLIRAIKRGEF